MEINIKDLTDNVAVTDKLEVTGDGIFDDIMETITRHIKAQFDAGRIRGEDYAQAYVQIITAVLQSAVQILLQRPQIEAEIDLIEAQIAQTEAQTELVKAQTIAEYAKEALLRRQIQGFDDDAKQKVLKHITELWGIAYSVAGTNNDVELPYTVTSQNLDQLMREVAADVGLKYPPVDD